MLRSLYSGISGLRSHQTMLDVTGNNIANVNTAGFKSSATQFQDTLSQLVQGAGGPQAATGGTNPAQVGLGVRVAGISTNFAQGAAQATGKSTDMMVSGDGFFVVRKGNESLYTRAGNFDFDPQGRLVTPDGGIVQGWAADAAGVVNDGGAIGPISLPLSAVSAPTATTSARVAGNLPGDTPVGGVLTRDIRVFAQDGSARMMSLEFTRTAGGWDVAASDGSVPTPATASTTLALAADGTLTLGGPLTVAGIGIDLSSVTGFAGQNNISITGQNGREAGTLNSFSIDKDGTIVGSFSNGDTRAVGRIALANFVNPGGLEKAGSSTYRSTVNSGAAELGTAGTGSLGSLLSGSIEMSNVDLSQEFTNLIVAQRGFQANARIITTSDEVLQELTNLKR